MGPRQRQLLLLGCAILAIVGAFMGYRLIRPQLGPARVEHDPLNGPPEGVAGDPPPRLTGAAGAGSTASNATPPPPAPPSSTTTTAPSVGRFRAVGAVQSGDEGPKIARAIVEVFSRWDDRELPIGRGETDEAGRFAVELPTLDVLPPAARAQMSLFARARAAGHRTGPIVPFVREEMSGAPRDVGGDVVLVLYPGHDVVGRVVDEEGRAVTGARVTMSDGAPLGRRSARTDAEGRFRLPVEAAASAYFLAELSGWGTGTIPPRMLTPDVEMVLPDLVLRRGAEVAGVVVDRTGRPVAGVPVDAESISRPHEDATELVEALAGTRYGSAMTDAAGRFRITGLFPGDVELEVVEGPQDGRATAPVRTGREDVRLVLAEHVVRVAVVDLAGGPVLGAAWRVDVTGAAPPRWRRGEVDIGEDVLGFVLVPEGARVVASATLLGWTPAKVEAFCAGPGVTDVVLRLSPAGAMGRMRLELTGEAAPRVTGIYVSLTLEADERGTPSLERPGVPGEVFEVPPGRYRLEVLPRTGTAFEPTDFVLSTAEITVFPGEETRVRLPVRRGGGVRLALEWPAGGSGGELQGIVATSLDGETAPTSLEWGQQRANGSTSSRGGFPIEAGWPVHLASGGLPAGRWMLEVRVAGYEPARVVAAIEEGKVAQVRVPLEPKPK